MKNTLYWAGLLGITIIVYNNIIQFKESLSLAILANNTTDIYILLIIIIGVLSKSNILKKLM